MRSRDHLEGTSSSRSLEQLKRYGVKRISLGIETFQNALLRAWGRTYTAEQAEEAIVHAKQVGFACVDVNLKKGARWVHRFQILFSLTFIDDVWTQCQKEPWPKQIILS
jgi:hypothetical protein